MTPAADHGAAAAGDISMSARFALVLTTWLSALAFVGLTPVLPQIERHFAAEPGAASLIRMLVTLVGVGVIAGCSISGFLAERFPEKRIVLAAIALFTLAGTAGFFLESIWLLLISRTIVGFSVGIIGVIATAILTTETLAGEREKWLGYYIVTGTAASCIILVTAGLIGNHNWRANFLLNLIGVPIFLLVLLWVQRRAVPQAASARTDGRKFPFPFVFLGIACGTVVSAPQIYIPFRLASLGWGDARWIAASLFCSTVVGGIASFFFGAIRRRVRAPQVFAIAFAMMAGGIATVIVSAEFAIVLVGMALYGVAVGSLPPNMFAVAAASSTRERSARTQGLVRSGFYAGPLLAQLLLEPVSARFGPAASLATLCAFAAVMIAWIARPGSSFVPSPLSEAP